MDLEEEEGGGATNEETEDYVVEAIRGWRYNYRQKRREFFIKWQNYEESENTWEPEANLNCPDILGHYIQTLDHKQLKYLYSSKPSKLTGFQRNATYLRCVGADGPHESDLEDSDKPNKQPFYCLILFEDSDVAEEVTLTEYMAYQPTEAFDFVECRLISKPMNKRSSFKRKFSHELQKSKSKHKINGTKHKHGMEHKHDPQSKHARKQKQDTCSKTIPHSEETSPVPSTSDGFYF